MCESFSFIGRKQTVNIDRMMREYQSTFDGTKGIKCGTYSGECLIGFFLSTRWLRLAFSVEELLHNSLILTSSSEHRIKLAEEHMNQKTIYIPEMIVPWANPLIFA